jgi:hypothetical protein
VRSTPTIDSHLATVFETGSARRNPWAREHDWNLDGADVVTSWKVPLLCLADA